METTAVVNGHKDVYGIITDRIIEQLTKGIVPWQQPWTDAGLPRNFITKRPYRGINTMLLASLGWQRNEFITSKQLNEIGGSIKPDARPHLVVFWKQIEKDIAGQSENEDFDKKKSTLLRYYTVFNVSQCVIPEKYDIGDRETVEFPSCEAVINAMPLKPAIKHKEQSAYYDPLRDYVNMPKKTSFKNDESYYSTLFHELIHSTGHRSRLNRPGVIEMSEFGSEPYSHEELVAEIGACYLQSHCNIQGVFEQSTAYIQLWIEKLQNDKKFIFSAARNAQKATDFILDIKPEEQVAHEE